MSTEETREKHLRENAQILELLPLEKLAALMNEDEFVSAVMEAITVSPKLMDRVAEVVDKILPSQLSLTDIADAQRLGRELAEKMVARMQ
jgi:succinylarginine dihydrolase